MPVYAQAPTQQWTDIGGRLLRGYQTGQNMFERKQRLRLDEQRYNQAIARAERADARAAEIHAKTMEAKDLEIGVLHRQNLDDIERRKLADTQVESLQSGIDTFQGEIRDFMGSSEGQDPNKIRNFMMRSKTRIDMLKASYPHAFSDPRTAGRAAETVGGVSTLLAEMGANIEGASSTLAQQMLQDEDLMGIASKEDAQKAYQVFTRKYGGLGMSANPKVEKMYADMKGYLDKSYEYYVRDADKREKEKIDKDLAQRDLDLPSLTPGEKKADETFAETFLEFGRKKAEIQKDRKQLTEAINALKGKDNLTGAFVSLLPERIRPKGVATKENVQEVVQRNLKTILGGQFAQQEAQELLNRAYNDVLPEATNAERVERLLRQLNAIFKAIEDKANYYQNNNMSLKGYKMGDIYIGSDYDIFDESLDDEVTDVLSE